MSQSQFNAAAETEVGYGQLFAVLLRRRFWLLGVFCGVFSTAILITLLVKPTYKSSMQLLVEPNYPKREKIAEEKSTDFPESKDQADLNYATQLNLMRSPMFFEKAIELLSPKYPDIDEKDLEKNLSLTQVVESGSSKTSTRIFQLVYTSNDAIKTRKVLETFQKLYQDYNLEQQKLRLTTGLAFINEELPTTRESVTQAERELEQFRKNQNLIDPEEQAKAVSTALNDVEEERRKTRTEYQETQTRFTAVQEQLARSPQKALTSSRLSQSERYQTLLNELQKTQLALEEQRATFTDADPRVQKLIDQHQRQRALLQEEAERVLGEVPAQLNLTGKDLLTEGQLGEIDQKLASQVVELQTSLQGLRARDQSLAKIEQQLRAELDRFPKIIAEYNPLQPEIETRREALKQLLERRQELGFEIAQGGFNWQVVEAPRRGKKIAPKPKQNLLLGIVAGLFLGGVAAFVREALDDAVHSSDALKKQVALPLLGIIPELPSSEANWSLTNLPFRKPQVTTPSILQIPFWPPFRESLDLIYKNIQLLNPSSRLSSLVVTSTLPGEGKSTLVFGLALSAARLHQRVLLIDADLRRPSLHQQLNLPNQQGLSTLLSGDATLPNPHRISLSGSNIDVLTAGPTPTDPVKLLSSPRMGELMRAFEQTYDLILLDTPPVLGMVDAIQIASFCSGVVMVGRLDRVTQSELMEATAMLSQLNVIGVVANGASRPTNSYVAQAEQNGSKPPRQYQPLVQDRGSNYN